MSRSRSLAERGLEYLPRAAIRADRSRSGWFEIAAELQRHASQVGLKSFHFGDAPVSNVLPCDSTRGVGEDEKCRDSE